MDAPGLDPSRRISVELNAQEWNLVHAALSELPHKVVKHLLRNIEMQLDEAVRQEA